MVLTLIRARVKVTGGVKPAVKLIFVVPRAALVTICSVKVCGPLRGHRW